MLWLSYHKERFLIVIKFENIILVLSHFACQASCDKSDRASDECTLRLPYEFSWTPRGVSNPNTEHQRRHNGNAPTCFSHELSRYLQLHSEAIGTFVLRVVRQVLLQRKCF